MDEEFKREALELITMLDKLAVLVPDSFVKKRFAIKYEDFLKKYFVDKLPPLI